MAEFKLDYTANEINEKLGKVGQPTSWNDLTDKPFYDIPPRFEMIEWDGNTDGKEFVSMGNGAVLCRVTNKFIELEDMIGGYGELTFADGSKQTAPATRDFLENASSLGFTDEKTWMMSNNGSPLCVCVHSAENGFYEGMYVLGVEGQMYVSKMYDKSDTKPIDVKYLPIKFVTLSTEDVTSSGGGIYTCTLNYDDIYDTFIAGGMVYIQSFGVFNNDGYNGQYMNPITDMVTSWAMDTRGLVCLIHHLDTDTIKEITFINGSHH